MYIVRTKEIEPIIEKHLKDIKVIPLSKNIDEILGSRFPFKFFQKDKLEVLNLNITRIQRFY